MGEAETLLIIKRLENDVIQLKEQQPAQESQIETVALELQSLHVKTDKLGIKVDAIDHKLSGKIDGLDVRVSRIEQTMATKFELIQLRNWMEDKFADVDTRFTEMDTQFAAINKQFAEMKQLIVQR